MDSTFHTLKASKTKLKAASFVYKEMNNKNWKILINYNKNKPAHCSFRTPTRLFFPSTPGKHGSRQNESSVLTSGHCPCFYTPQSWQLLGTQESWIQLRSFGDPGREPQKTRLSSRKPIWFEQLLVFYERIYYLSVGFYGTSIHETSIFRGQFCFQFVFTRQTQIVFPIVVSCFHQLCREYVNFQRLTTVVMIVS